MKFVGSNRNQNSSKLFLPHYSGIVSKTISNPLKTLFSLTSYSLADLPIERKDGRPFLCLFGDHADVGDRCAFGHRRYRADVKHDAGDRRTGFKNYFAGVVSDVTHFHSFFDVRSTLERRIKYSRLLAGQRHDLLEPDG